MKVNEILAKYDEQVRRNVISEPGIEVERSDCSVRMSGLWNLVLYSKLTASSADREIESQKRHFECRGEKVEWKLYGHDKPADLPDRLRQAGFQSESTERFLVLDLHKNLPNAKPPANTRFERMNDERGLNDLAEVGKSAFGEDYSSMNNKFLARIPLRTVSFFVAYRDQQPVCGGRLETPPNSEFAGLYGGGTVPEYRHQGIYRSLVAIRAKEALELGYRFLTVDAADSSFPILERMGFVEITTVCGWVYKPDSSFSE